MHFYRLLRDFLTDYLIVKRNLSKETAKAYRQSLNILRQYFCAERNVSFDQMNFACFSRSNIYDFLIWLRDTRNCSIQTLNLRLAAIKSFLKYCAEEDIELTSYYLDITGIHAFKGAKKPCVEYLTPSQLKLLFSLPDVTTKLGRRNRFFMIFAYETGTRIQELLDLRLASVIPGDKNVRVRIMGKGNKVRYVPLLESTVMHMDAYLAEFHRESPVDAFLFYTIHDGQKTKMTAGTVDYFLKKYGKEGYQTDSTFPAGLHAHMLRHSIAMAMHKQGIPISYIRDFLGHRSIETTSIYSHADEETIAKALESLEPLQTGDQPSTKHKNWKGKEQHLLEYCGLV
jgi:integrase/recombinase XerD